jgi:hypothetical protein
MKLPKTVIIGGREWTVTTNPKINGASSNNNKTRMEIGTAGGTENACQNFLHEVIESILDERMKRFQQPYAEPNNGHYVFVFNHAEFEEMVKDIYLALKGIIRDA